MSSNVVMTLLLFFCAVIGFWLMVNKFGTFRTDLTTSE